MRQRWHHRIGRRVAAVGTATVLVLGQLIAVSPPAQAADPVTLNLLTINDFHGRIDANTVKFGGTVEGLRQGDGAAGANTLLIGAGDFIGASLFASAIEKDQPTIDVMNELGLNVSSVGNHEFDQGFADLTDRVIAGGTNAKWNYLGANVYRKGTTDPALPAYGTYQVGGLTVGVIGAVTQETPTLVSPAGVSTLDFGDPVDAINRVAGQLTDGDPSNGEADVLVATLHEGGSLPGVGSTAATLDQQLAASAVFTKIVTQTSPKVSAIVTGHTHQAYAYQAPMPGDPSRTRPIVQTGNYGANVGQIKLTVDRDSKAVTATTVANVARVATDDAALIAQYPRLAAVRTTVDAALRNAAVVGNQPVGSVDADITTATTPDPTATVCSAQGVARDDRGSESTLGNLVANSLLDTLNDPDRGAAVIGVVNPGGLRAELCRGTDGVITYAAANSVLPFSNNLGTTSLTGAQVKTMLEQQWQTTLDGTAPSRPYLQLGLSDNVTYTFDPNAAQGSHITSVTVDGKPLDPTATYRVGTFSFLLSGGDNFRVFTAGTDTRDSGLLDRDAWIAYLQANPQLSPDFARHAVQVTGQPSTVDAGGKVTFDVAGLDLTSVGSPANTTLAAKLVPATGPSADLGSFAVAGGAAQVALAVPADAPAGAANLVLTAAPSNTVVTIPVTVRASMVALTASAPSQVYGATNPVTLTATVTGSAGTPTGSVVFSSGDEVLATVSLAGGAATYRLPADRPAGSYPIVARYTGDDANPPADSAPVTVTVAKASSVTLLAPGLSLPLVGTLLVGAVGLNNGRPATGSVQIAGNGTAAGSTAVQRSGLFIFLAPRPAKGKGTTFIATFVPADPGNIDGSTSNPVVVRR